MTARDDGAMAERLRLRLGKLATVAHAADDWRLSNDISDELHDALDDLSANDLTMEDV